MSTPDLPLQSAIQKEYFKRTIDDCEDLEQLKEITKSLIDSFYANKEQIRQLYFNNLPPRWDNTPEVPNEPED